MSVGLSSLQSLTQEFEQTKERLRVVEDDIKKHTGRRNVPQSNFRHPRDAPPGLRSQLANRLDDGPLRRRSQGGAFSRLGRQLNVHEAQRMGQPGPPQVGPPGLHQGPVLAKDQGRLATGTHGPHAAETESKVSPRMGLKRDRIEREPPEDGELEDGPPRKVGLLSSIGASSLTVKGKSRSELLSEQSGDQNVKARNRRMFGMILGTLKSFEKEEVTKRKEQVEKKVEKEQKVEEQKEREREEAVRLRRELIEEKRDKQIKLRQLQAKMEVVGAFEEFSKRHGHMANFIHTAAKPPLMWLPRLLTPACEESLSRSRAKIEAIVLKEQQRVELELERIEGIQRDSDGEVDGKENTCGSTMPSSVAVVVNNDSKDAQDAKTSKHNGSADGASVKEKATIDPEMKNIKIIIENDLAVKKNLNGEGSVYAAEDETLEQMDDTMEQQQEESKQGEQKVERHALEDSAEEGVREEDFTDPPEKDNQQLRIKDEHIEKKRFDSESKSKSRSPSPQRSKSADQQDECRQPVEEESSAMTKRAARKTSPVSCDNKDRKMASDSKEKVSLKDVNAKRAVSPPTGESPRRSRTPTKSRPTLTKKRDGISSSSSSSSAASRSSSSNSSTSSSSSDTSSSDSPKRTSRKAPVSVNEGGAGSMSSRKRSRSPVPSAKKSPQPRGRRSSSSPRPAGKRRGVSPPNIARRSRSPKRRSRTPRRRSPGGSPLRKNNSIKRRSVSRRRSPSPRRRRRSSSPKRRSLSGGRRRPNRQRSGSRGPPRRGSPIRRRSRSRSPRRAPRRSRSPRRRR